MKDVVIKRLTGESLRDDVSTSLNRGLTVMGAYRSSGRQRPAAQAMWQ